MGNRNCQFLVMSGTGEKPRSSIHIVGFEEEGGIECVAHIEGHLGDHLSMVCSLVESVGKTAKEKGGQIGASVFLMELMKAVTEGMGRETLEFTGEMLGAFNHESLEKLISEMTEEEDEDDGEL